MMTNKNVTAGDEIKTACDDSDDDDSGDKWFAPNGKSNYVIVVFHHIASINLSITRQHSHRWCNG